MPSLISGMAYVRLSAPDLGHMQAFLEDFGMLTVHRDASRLYMRGIGDTPYLHVTELGAPGVVSFAYELREPGQLTELAKILDVSAVEQLDAPGGGARVRLRDPNGLWLVLGQSDAIIGQFDRLDLGDTLVDHHVIFLLKGHGAGMHHVSYEVQGVD